MITVSPFPEPQASYLDLFQTEVMRRMPYVKTLNDRRRMSYNALLLDHMMIDDGIPKDDPVRQTIEKFIGDNLGRTARASHAIYA